MSIVNYDGVCPICGSVDGMIIQGKDGRYRNMCRVNGCPAKYLPAPAVGFAAEDDCRKPFDTDYLKGGNVTYQEYLTGGGAE